MTWLSPEECLLYAPNIKLSGEALSSAISIAQMLVEGVNGANRPLSIAAFTKVINIPRNGRILVPITPLLASPPPIVQLRGMDLAPRFGSFSSQEWEQLTSDQDYVVDYQNNEIALLGLNRILRQDSVYTGFRRYHRPPTAPYGQRQAKIIYYSGFDFTLDSPEINNLKMALASIVALRNSPQSQGVKSLEVSDEEYKITYASQSDYIGISNNNGGVSGSPINELLSIFKAYRPIEFVV